MSRTSTCSINVDVSLLILVTSYYDAPVEVDISELVPCLSHLSGCCNIYKPDYYYSILGRFRKHVVHCPPIALCETTLIPDVSRPTLTSNDANCRHGRCNPAHRWGRRGQQAREIESGELSGCIKAGSGTMNRGRERMTQCLS